jgi:hypothetical protein
LYSVFACSENEIAVSVFAMMAVTELGIEKVLCPTISEPFFLSTVLLSCMLKMKKNYLVTTVLPRLQNTEGDAKLDPATVVTTFRAPMQPEPK